MGREVRTAIQNPQNQNFNNFETPLDSPKIFRHEKPIADHRFAFNALLHFLILQRGLLQQWRE
jgi:hypothetical protein